MLHQAAGDAATKPVRSEGHGGSYGSTREKGERRGEQVPVHRGPTGGKPAALVETYVRTSIRCPVFLRLMSAYIRHLHSTFTHIG